VICAESAENGNLSKMSGAPNTMNAGFWRWLVASVCCALALAPANSRADAPIRDPEYRFRVYAWNYKELKQRQIVMQKQDYSCGAAVLATVFHYYWGEDVGEAYFLDLLPEILNEEQMKDRIKNGLTLTDLRDVCNKAGYAATMLKVQFSELSKGKVPVIVGITVKKHEHFVVFRGTDGVWAYLADPIRGQVRVPISTFLEQWQRNAILVVAKKGEDIKEVNPMGIKEEEINRGWLTWQTIRANWLAAPVPNPFPTRP
jgi:uncharacterized protein